MCGAIQLSPAGSTLSRRRFSALGALAAVRVLCSHGVAAAEGVAPVAVVKGSSRAEALTRAIELAGPPDLNGKDVYLKGNYNSPRPFPATTHPDALRAVVLFLQGCGCRSVTLVERSGMGSTADIWETLGIPELARKLELHLLSLDNLPAVQWRKHTLAGSHWRDGVEAPAFLDSGTVVQLANLNSHRFGGHFSASLKNSIGLIAKRSSANASVNYMAELHASADQRSMIAEVNQIYTPAFVAMDAGEVFVQGGPESGEVSSPGIFLASRDRVAIDAAGVALLRIHGAGPPLSRVAVFEQDQIKRAVELGLGAAEPEQVRFAAPDSASESVADKIRSVLTVPSLDEKKS